MVLRLKTRESRSSPGLPRTVLEKNKGPIRALIEIIPLFHDRWFATSGLATKRQKPPPDHSAAAFLRLSCSNGQAQRRHLDVSRFPARTRAPARASRRAVLGKEGLGRLVDHQGRICGRRESSRGRQ